MRTRYMFVDEVGLILKPFTERRIALKKKKSRLNLVRLILLKCRSPVQEPIRGS